MSMNILRAFLTRMAQTTSKPICVYGAVADTTKKPQVWINVAGLVCVTTRRYAVHLLVRPSHWKWGHHIECYDTMFDYYGAGPLCLVVRDNIMPPVDPATCRCPGALDHNGQEWCCADCWKSLRKTDPHAHGVL